MVVVQLYYRVIGHDPRGGPNPNLRPWRRGGVHVSQCSVSPVVL